MTGDQSEGITLAPDEAFAVLGNESRMNILRSLGEADGRLSFSELYDRVGVGDSGQFSYHLDKLRDHFVHKTDEGYELRQAGLRVVEAVLSGAITEAPAMEPAITDSPCPHCGAKIEVSYGSERLLRRCTECSGGFRGGRLPEGTLERGYLPPAGLRNRTTEELILTRNTWSVIDHVAMVNDVCPRCSGHVDHSVHVCEQHAEEGICEQCDRRKAILVASRCQNCPHENTGYITRLLFGEPAFRAFFESRGVDLFALPPEAGELFVRYDEELLGTDPFKARFTFTVEDDTITVTVDEALSVVDLFTEPSSPSG